MPRKKVVKPYVRKPGYSLADLLVLTDATKSELTHWTKSGIVRAAIEETSGRGHHRRFSAFNVIETQLAVVVNKLRVPAETVLEALNTFREFHRQAVAIHEQMADAPVINPEHLSLFSTVEQRHSVARSFVMRFFNAFSNANRDQAGIDRALQLAGALGDAWHHTRTGSVHQGHS